MMAALVLGGAWFYSKEYRIAQTPATLETAEIVEILRSRPGYSFLVKDKDGNTYLVAGKLPDTRYCLVGSTIALDRRGKDLRINALGCRLSSPDEPQDTND